MKRDRNLKKMRREKEEEREEKGEMGDIRRWEGLPGFLPLAPGEGR